MSALSIIAKALDDGVTVALDTDGKLKVRGNEQAIARWLPEVREQKAALLDALAEPRRLWLVLDEDGRLMSHSFTPPVALAKVQERYPDAVSIVPEPDTAAQNEPTQAQA